MRYLLLSVWQWTKSYRIRQGRAIALAIALAIGNPLEAIALAIGNPLEAFVARITACPPKP